MADFSLTTLFVVPVGSSLPSPGSSTQNLTAGQVGIFGSDYVAVDGMSISTSPYFYVAQGRVNTYLQGTKRSDKIAGCYTYTSRGEGSYPTGGCRTNVTEWYKVSGCPTPSTQVTDVGNWNVTCGEIVTVTLRAHSSYLDTLYFNGFTRSVTVQAPCCDCGADPCDQVDIPALIDSIIQALENSAPNFLQPPGTGTNPDNITLTQFYQFQRIGNDASAILRISGKPLTKYGQPCDVSAFPWEYDRMWFRTFVYQGPATTADFIVADSCNIVADATITQRASYPIGTSGEIAQLEKNYYSYQAGYLKHLYRMAGYNGNFESWVVDGVTYDTFYIKFNEYDRSAYSWGDYIHEDSMVIIAAPAPGTSGAGTISADIQTVLEGALGPVYDDTTCVTTTSTTTTVWPTTSTTSTLIP